MRAFAGLVACGFVIGAAGVAGAFPTGEQFDGDPLKTDGGGGIAFDGSPRWTGHACDACHTDPPGLISIKLESDPDTLFSQGWDPGTQYHMRVVLVGEHEGIQFAAAGDNCGFAVTPYSPCDTNGMSIEMDSDAGKPVGKLVPVVGTACVTSGSGAPSDAAVRILADGTAATHAGLHSAETSWDVCWTAPAAGTGTVTAYVAIVDGNGGDGTINFPNNTTGDDVAAGAVPIAELGATQGNPQTGGCGAAGDASAATALALIALAAIARGRRRRLMLVLALATAGGCVHVHPRERETLARRDMKFSPDPTEDELDLHMQEAREGAAGGYGTAGGGCGCN